MMADKIEVSIKAWEVYQGLAQGMGENCWKVRSVFVSLSSAIIAYGYTSKTPFLYVVAAMVAPVFLLMEAGYRRLQEQFFRKSMEIEVTINDFLADEPNPRFPDAGIGTRLEVPRLAELVRLFRLKRFLFWMPYLVFFAFPLVLYWLEATALDLTRR